jgi:hypothetical protein
MLKKKDPSKPFWKRLIKSAEKVKKNYFYSRIIFILPVFQCQWIVVDWNHFTAEGKFANK